MTEATCTCAAAHAAQRDEQRLIYEASRAFTQAKTLAALENAWALHVVPLKTSIDAETLDMLQRLRDLRRFILA